MVDHYPLNRYCTFVFACFLARFQCFCLRTIRYFTPFWILCFKAGEETECFGLVLRAVNGIAIVWLI